MFLICQKEESVRRAFEAVLQRAESDKKFAELIAEKAKRVRDAKKKCKALKTHVPPPKQKTMERLTRRILEFSEDVRAYSMPSEGVAG